MGTAMLSYSDMRALVIDDQPFVRRTVATMLQQIGFGDVIEAEEGASGLKAYTGALPSLVICDIEMKPVDGLTFLASLRAEERRLGQAAPVIFLTSHASSDIVRRARSLRVDSFLLKPTTVADLRRRVDHVMAPHLAPPPKPACRPPT